MVPLRFCAYISSLSSPNLSFLQLSSSESIQQQLSFLNKQLLLLGEAHKLCVQELHQAGPDTSKVQKNKKSSVSFIFAISTIYDTFLSVVVHFSLVGGADAADILGEGDGVSKAESVTTEPKAGCCSAESGRAGDSTR